MGTSHSGKTKLIQHFLQTDGIRQDLMKEGAFTTDVRMSRCVCTFTCAHTLHFLLHSLLLFPYSSREDGRYKCKVVVDDCPRLLLIREDTGIPSHEVRSCGHVTWSCGGHVTWSCGGHVTWSCGGRVTWSCGGHATWSCGGHVMSLCSSPTGWTP